MIEHWNADGALPGSIDTYCAELAGTRKWRATFETMTGKAFSEVKERTRCVAVASGLQEVVRAGCTLPKCNPEMSCATCVRRGTHHERRPPSHPNARCDVGRATPSAASRVGSRADSADTKLVLLHA